MSPLDSPPAESAAQKRWGDALNAGFVVLPVVLLRHQKDLRLSDGELVVLLNVVASWWYSGKLPFPSTQTIATRMGVTPRTVQRHLISLEKKGLLKHLPRSHVPETDVLVVRYDPSGLVELLKTFGAQFAPRQAKARAKEGVPA